MSVKHASTLPDSPVERSSPMAMRQGKNAMHEALCRTTQQLAWGCLAVAGIAWAASAFGVGCWVLCAPLLCWKLDVATWVRKEKTAVFADKVALITGGSTGIGLSMAKLLTLRKVRRLILVSRSLPRLEKARATAIAFAKLHGETLTDDNFLLIPFDVSKTDGPDDAWKDMVSQAVAWQGRIDYAFLNAGRFALGSFPKYAIVEEIMRTNVFSCVKLCDELLPHFKERNSGHFVFTNSVCAYLHPGGLNAYATSKAALLAYSTMLNQDLIGSGFDGIKVTSVHPGIVFTSIHKNTLDPEICKGTTPESVEHDDVPWASGNWSKGLESDECAEYILRGVSNNLLECWMAVIPTMWKMYAAYYLRGIFTLVNRMLAQSQVEYFNGTRKDMIKRAQKCN